MYLQSVLSYTHYALATLRRADG